VHFLGLVLIVDIFGIGVVIKFELFCGVCLQFFSSGIGTIGIVIKIGLQILIGCNYA
jgi:hypothetical protein